MTNGIFIVTVVSIVFLVYGVAIINSIVEQRKREEEFEIHKNSEEFKQWERSWFPKAFEPVKLKLIKGKKQ